MNEFLAGYIECALWASTDEDGEPFDDNYDETDLAPETLKQMTEDCADFQQANAALLAQAQEIRKTYTDAYAGHDFWLSRCGHGAGFFDRGLGEVGDQLQRAAKIYGSENLYEGEDGKIYC